jgi:hypothetical protein
MAHIYVEQISQEINGMLHTSSRISGGGKAFMSASEPSASGVQSTLSPVGNGGGGSDSLVVRGRRVFRLSSTGASAAGTSGAGSSGGGSDPAAGEEFENSVAAAAVGEPDEDGRAKTRSGRCTDARVRREMSARWDLWGASASMARARRNRRALA